MPIIKSAIKKMRQDEKRTAANRAKKRRLREILKLTKEKPTIQNLARAFSLLDKGAKTHLIHKNKAARLKSRLSKLIKGIRETKGTQGTKVKKTSIKKRTVKKSV